MKQALYDPQSYRNARRFFVLSVLILVFCGAFAPMAQEPEGGVLDNILVIVAAFATLAGVSALIGVLVALARKFGIVSTDEQAGKVTAGLNLLAFVVLAILGVFRPDLSLDFLDGIAAQLATIALFVLGLITQLIVPAPILRAFYHARVPVLGEIGERNEARAMGVKVVEPGTSENWSGNKPVK